MSDRLDRLVGGIAQANDAWAERLDSTASLRRARFIAAAKQEPQSARSRWWFAGMGGVLAAAAVLLVVWLWPAGRIDFTVDGEVGLSGALIAADTEAIDLAFSDGTTVRAEPGAHLQVEPLENGARLELARGRVDLSVKKRPAARWLVAAGPYEVVVVGTEFGVFWDPDARRFSVAVVGGRVNVTGPGVDRTLGPGEELAVEPPAQVVAAAPAQDPEAGAFDGPPGKQAPEAKPAKPTPVPRRAGRPEADWKKLAAAGKHDEAFAAAARGGFSRRCAKADVADLSELADVARYAGKTKAAREALLSLRRRFRGTAAAKRAAYRLGRLEFEQARRYGEAGRWFRTYLDESPRGSLAAAAMGRLIESYKRNGQKAKARAEAKRYLERFPDGPHAELARKLAG